jgi:uncharacterized protein (TIGR02284 family)
MAEEKDGVVTTLNNLIEACKDREYGYRTAAGGARNKDLKTLFETYERQSADYAAELQRDVARLGAAPEDKGTLGGWLLRGWMNAKTAVTGGGDRALIAECERGEDAARQNYERALLAPLPADVRAVVERQHAGVKEAHDRLRALEAAAGQGG